MQRFLGNVTVKPQSYETFDLDSLDSDGSLDVGTHDGGGHMSFYAKKVTNNHNGTWTFYEVHATVEGEYEQEEWTDESLIEDAKSEFLQLFYEDDDDDDWSEDEDDWDDDDELKAEITELFGADIVESVEIIRDDTE